MPTAYYSTIFQERAADIWEIVRDFNNYPVWVDGCGESRIEDASLAMRWAQSETYFIRTGRSASAFSRCQTSSARRHTSFAAFPPCP